MIKERDVLDSAISPVENGDCHVCLLPHALLEGVQGLSAVYNRYNCSKNFSSKKRDTNSYLLHYAPLLDSSSLPAKLGKCLGYGAKTPAGTVEA